MCHRMELRPRAEGNGTVTMSAGLARGLRSRREAHRHEDDRAALTVVAERARHATGTSASLTTAETTLPPVTAPGLSSAKRESPVSRSASTSAPYRDLPPGSSSRCAWSGASRFGAVVAVAGAGPTGRAWREAPRAGAGKDAQSRADRTPAKSSRAGTSARAGASADVLSEPRQIAGPSGPRGSSTRHALRSRRLSCIAPQLGDYDTKIAAAARARRPHVLPRLA